MLSMWKLLASTILLGSLLGANDNAKIEEFLAEKFKENPAIVSLNVKIIDKLPIPTLAGWDALVVLVDAMVKAQTGNKAIQQKMIWFTNGQVITKELTDINSGESVKDLVSPPFKDEYYKKKNLVYGEKNAKYKVAIFSDPLCPFCNNFVPGAIEEMKKYPEKFAVYYYHLPLASLHPASVEIAQAAIAAELNGIKNVVLRMYDLKIDPNERDVRKILDVFNRKLGTDLKPDDLLAKEVQEQYQSDLKIAEDMMVGGTPSVYFNGKLDKTKRLYQRAH